MTKRSSEWHNLGAPTSAREPVHCQLCQREVEQYTSHHLVPRSRGGRFGPTVMLCSTCHRQLHALFSEATLAKELNTVEMVRSNPQMADYLRWARRQKSATSFRVRRANGRR